MIIEIGASLAVAGSIVGVVATAIDCGANVRKARAQAEKFKDLADRRKMVIAQLRGAVERLKEEVAVTVVERDDARRIAERFQPIRDRTGRFVSRSPALPFPSPVENQEAA